MATDTVLGEATSHVSLGQTFTRFASVVLDAACNKLLDYGVTEEQSSRIHPGSRVQVPLRGSLAAGYVVEVKETTDVTSVRGIASLLSEEEAIPAELLRLACWMSSYYCSPLRPALKSVLPASVRKGTRRKEQYVVSRAMTRDVLRQKCIELRQSLPPHAAVLESLLGVSKEIWLSELLEKSGATRAVVKALEKKGFLKIEKHLLDRSPLEEAEFLPSLPKVLREEQQQALDKIVQSLQQGSFSAQLLWGITGSGKTEVYLQAIDHALKMGKSSIFLVPEISLTTQTVERLRGRFEGRIAVLHHRLSQGERTEAWRRLLHGDARVVVGARSAVFSPVVNLGLILVDEEHENAYKQSDEGPCYHARDVAVMRGKLSQATVVLGSATPSLESFHNALEGKYGLTLLHQRADAATLPAVSLVDMRREYEKAKGFTLFSERLLSALQKRQERGEQAILFLNRRGYHAALMCPSCQTTWQCPHCDVALTFHRGEEALACHLCGYVLSPVPRCCPRCHETTLKFRGAGTEQVERALHAVLPQMRTLRVDADTTRHKGSQERLFKSFRTGKADVLIGTQMISKGLHFPAVTLVGILNSDASLNIPDFRASETTFQLVTQVAGRAGREMLAGEVILQTCMPENATLQRAAHQDYQGFFEEESSVRRQFGYPPFCRLAKVRFSGTCDSEVLRVAEEFRQQLIRVIGAQADVHPVLPAGHPKVKDSYQFQFIARTRYQTQLSQVLARLREKVSLPRGIHLLVDIDPVSTYF